MLQHAEALILGIPLTQIRDYQGLLKRGERRANVQLTPSPQKDGAKF